MENFRKEAIENPIDLAAEATTRSNGVIPFGPDPSGQTLLVTDPEIVHEILVKKHREFVEDKHPFIFSKPALSQAGHKVLRQRPAVPTDNPLEGIDNLIVKKTLSRFESIDQGKEQIGLDVLPPLALLCLDIMGKVMFDYEMGPLGDKFYEASMTHENLLAVARRGDPQITQSEEFRAKGKKALDDQNDVMRVIKEAVVKDSPSLQDLPKGLSLEFAMMRTMLNAYAGISTSLAWTTLLLANFEDKQKKLQEELDQKTGPITFEDLKTLPYTQMVINESLRLFPPAWMMTRECLEDTSIKGFDFPNGANVLICTYSLHRDEKYWSDADDFQPERFDTPNGGAPDTCFIPFGAGPHRCPGQPFAMQIMSIILATLSKRYEFVSDCAHDIEPFPKVALRPEPGAMVFLKKRSSPV